MNVELKEMHLRNFKGVMDQTFTFSHNTVVRGTNGTGKTTLFDAFTFALFGKDSNGRTDFGYKRRDVANGCGVIHELEYSVEVVLLIDGVEKRFERTMVEKWTKPRGAKEKVLTGNECSYYIDRVRCSTKKEYDAAVNSIASEEVLRIMTDVHYFISQKDDYKKSMLLEMAYGTSDVSKAEEMVVSEVLSAIPQFTDFVNKLNGVQVADFNKTVGSKIRAIKQEIESIPTKIAAKKETMPPAEDWEALQVIIDDNREQLAEIDRQIADENARQSGATQYTNKLRSDLSNLQLELLKAENAIRAAVNEQEMTQRNQIFTIDTEIRRLTDERTRYANQVTSDNAKIEQMNQTLARMREQWRAMNENRYQYADNELYCPTCHRPYDVEKLKEQKMAENKNRGIALKAERDNHLNEVALLNEKIGQIDVQLQQYQQQREQIGFQPADVNWLILNDPTCINIRQKMDDIKTQISNAPATLTNPMLLATKKEIEDKISSFTRQLGARELIETVKAQVAELERKQSALNAELADLETMQDTAKEFQKAKDNALLEKVNHLFSIVTWDFVCEQLNGNDKITCNCYVDGMPYGERNHAGQVNAGLDIINAIARSKNIHLPIFIDNAESVVEYLPTDSQKILLKVDQDCKQLKFEL